MVISVLLPKSVTVPNIVLQVFVMIAQHHRKTGPLVQDKVGRLSHNVPNPSIMQYLVHIAVLVGWFATRKLQQNGPMNLLKKRMLKQPLAHTLIAVAACQHVHCVLLARTVLAVLQLHVRHVLQEKLTTPTIWTVAQQHVRIRRVWHPMVGKQQSGTRITL
jgi:hypothetical protein